MRLLITFIFIQLSLLAISQNTVSPYSIFGPGEIERKGFGTTQNLGGAGIAYQSGSNLNNINPSSYTSMDSMKLIFAIGLENKFYNLNSSSRQQSGYTGNINYLALGFKYTNWMAGSIGFVPFSSVGYSVAKQNYVEGANEVYTSVYTGSGGINQIYFGNAIRLLKNFSIGINASYMFGPLIQDENLDQTEYSPELQISRQDFLQSFYFDYGMQYSFRAKKTDFALGFIFSNKQKLKSNHILTVYNGSHSILRYEQYDTDYLKIPMIFGSGIGIKKDGRYNLLLDYEFQKWSGVSYPIQYNEFVNSHNFSLGLAFRPWNYSVLNRFYENLEYQVGFNYHNSYQKFDNYVVSGGSVSFGTEIPLPSRISKISIGIEFGINGTPQNLLIQEKYTMLRLGFSLNEFAFIKRKFD